MKAILSIKPEFVEKIFSGEKEYEYRKSIFKKPITSVIIYCTMPVGKFVGEFKIEDILYEDVEELWSKTEASSGISYKFYKEYFNNKEKAYALKIKDLKKYKSPIVPSNIIPDFKAPQSFCYFSE